MAFSVTHVPLFARASPTRIWSLAPLVLVAGLLTSAPVLAHIALVSPFPRESDQKAGPCGVSGSERPESAYTAFPPGAVVTVRWTETIDHPGHFRISFDDDGEDGLVDPAAFDDFDSAPSVLVDAIVDQDGGDYEQQVTLPNVECERCTLQLIQVMTDKAPYGDGNDLYYQCADIALREGAPAEGEEVGAPPPEATTGCSHVNASGGATSWSMLALLALPLLLRRRRRR